ncbi:MAG: 50S ribosomal protein L23 [Bdellovibrionota bacterium]
MQAYNVLKKPLLTEKTTMLKEQSNQVSFEVAMDANKHAIKHAIETAFQVKVDSVSTMIVRGKNKTMGRYRGKKSNWKKAIVRLAEGSKIDLFEGV